MGIPTYTRWLCRKYPKILQNVPEDNSQDRPRNELPDPRRPNPLGYEIDNFYIDMNGIIHDCCHGSDLDIIPSCEDDIFENISNYVDRLFSVVRPRQLLFLAIDGVAPWAKVNQQRTRRYKSTIEYNDIQKIEDDLRREMEAEGHKLPPKRPVDWSSSFISPCTPFMNRLSSYLNYYIQKQLNISSGWSNLNVILSDSSVPGEGEHKIIDYIRRQRTQPNYCGNQTHILHGLDADLSMLSLATHEARCSILVEQLFVNRCRICGGTDHVAANCMKQPRRTYGKLTREQRFLNRKLQLINVSVLREYLDFEFEDIKYKLPFCYDLERIIDDYICICTFVGNDFVPPLPTLEIKEGGLTMLLNIYKRLLPTWSGYIVNQGTLDMTRIKDFLQELDPLEDVILSKRRYYYTHTPPPSTMTKKMTSDKTITTSSNSHGNNNQNDDDDEEESVVNTLVHEMSRALESVMPASEDISTKITNHNVSLEKNNITPSNNTNSLDVSNNRKQVETVTEAQILEQEYDMRIRQLIRQYFNNIEITDEIDMGTPGWRDRYYAGKFKFDLPAQENLIDKACDDYLTTLQWIVRYYTQGCPDWTWAYPHHYAPSTRQILNATERNSIPFVFKKTSPPAPLFSLLAIQTPSSAPDILPAKLAALVTDPKSPIKDLYPSSFTLDFNLRRYRWLAIPQIPVLDHDALYKIYRETLPALTDEEKKINQLGKDLIYIHRSNPIGYILFSKYPHAVKCSYNKQNISGTVLPNEPIGTVIHYDNDEKYPPVNKNNVYKCTFTGPPFYPQFTSQLLTDAFPPASTLTVKDRILQEPHNWIGINISHLGRIGMVRFNPIRHYSTCSHVPTTNSLIRMKQAISLIKKIHF